MLKTGNKTDAYTIHSFLALTLPPPPPPPPQKKKKKPSEMEDNYKSYYFSR